MSNLIRWEPMQDMVSLREAMDRLFNDAFTRPIGPGAGWHSPAVDVYQTDQEVVVRASLPGFKAEDVQISITGDVLSLKGELKESSQQEEKSYSLREQHTGAFERTFRLPSEVEGDKAAAEFEDGILTITLPKAEQARPRTITVKAK